MLALLGCDPPSMHKYVTIENKRNESIKVFVDGEFQEPTFEAKSTHQLTKKQFVGGAIGIVVKSKDGKELWKKEYRGSEMNEIRDGGDLRIVVPESK